MWCVLLMTVCGLQQPHLVLLHAQHSRGTPRADHDLSMAGGRPDTVLDT